MKQPLAWYLRVGITFCVTILIAIPVVHWLIPVLIPWIEKQDWTLNRRLPFVVARKIPFLFLITVLTAPPILSCIACYHFLSFRHVKRGETYCGNCHERLKDLVVPSCQSCGKDI